MASEEHKGTATKDESTPIPASLSADPAPAFSASKADSALAAAPTSRSDDEDEPEDDDRPAAGRQSLGGKDRASVQFPWTLHQLLAEAEMNGNGSIISWIPNTNAFKVHNKVRFTNEILPRYFNASKYKSFQRNLNLWGFEAVQDGPNKGAVFHRLFIRGQKDQCHFMIRQKVKGVGKQGRPKGAGKIGPGFADFAPSLAGSLKSSKLSANDLKGLSFPKKLHHILAQPGFSDCVVWTPDGRCIRVVDPFNFQERVATIYFSHTSFTSFLVELESYGFKKVSHAGFQECYYHDLMIRGCPHLCKYMSDPTESRRFISNDPSKDLLIDQAFGVPSIIHPVPGRSQMSAMISPDSTATGALVHDFQQRQQLATLQLLAAGGGNHGVQLGLMNPALLGNGIVPGGHRTSMSANLGSSAPAALGEQKTTSTPISNYLANSSQNHISSNARAEAV